MNEAPLLSVQDVSIGYGGRPIMAGITLRVGPGDFLGLVGPNGAGKSTLLRTMLGIIPAISGSVQRRPELQVGYVPQRSRLDPIFGISALEVVRMGGMGSGRRLLRSASARQGRDALGRVGMAQHEHDAFRDLSGGQQQRVLIARAMVREPDVLVLDEPTAGMDLPSERELLDFVSELKREQTRAVILVAHQLGQVAGRVRSVAIMNKDLSQFAVGDAADILTSHRLTELYGTPMRVTQVGKDVIVRAAGEHEA